MVLPAKTSCCQHAMGGPTVPIWSPADITSKNNIEACFGDGGVTDSCGLLALLRRRCKKVIVQSCDSFSLLDNATATQVGNVTWWASYFGCAEAGSLSGYSMTPEAMNKQSQVFDKASFQPLLDQFVEKGKAGKPMTVDVTLDVLDNPLCGVQGGWKVRLLWCFPFLSDGFRNA